MNWSYIASGLAAVTFCVHTFVGGIYVARPLLFDIDLPRAAKWLAYYCWHIATVLLAFTALGFLAEGIWPSDKRLSIFLTITCFATSALSVYVARKGEIHPLRFPSTSLLALTGLGGLVSIFVH